MSPASPLQFHLRTLPAILVYMAATGMAFVFGVGSLFLFGMWWATAKRQSKSGHAAAGPLSAELSDESDVGVDAESGAQQQCILHLAISNASHGALLNLHSTDADRQGSRRDGADAISGTSA